MLAQAWLIQALPTLILNSPSVSEYASGGDNPKFGTATDIVGIIFFAIGLFWEATGDIQKVSSHADQADISTCTSRATRPRENRALKDFGVSRGTLLTLERFSSTGVSGCCVVSDGMTALTLVAPSNNGRVSGGARAAQYAAVVAPIFTILL